MNPTTPAALHSSFEVVSTRRTIPSSHSPLVPVPSKESIRDVEGYVTDCLNVYTRDWKQVKFKGELDEKRASTLSPRGTLHQGLSVQDISASPTSSEKVFDFSTAEGREQTGMFSVYKPKGTNEKSIGRIYSIESPFQEKPSTLVSVELREVRLSAAQLVASSGASATGGGSGTPRGSSIRDGPATVNEPIFTTITLVDIKQKERRSETFFYIHHPEAVGDMVVLNPTIPYSAEVERSTGVVTPMSLKDKAVSLGNLNYNPSSPSTSPISAKKPPTRAPPATPTRMISGTGLSQQYAASAPEPVLLPGLGKPLSDSPGVPPLSLKNLMPGQAQNRRANSSETLPSTTSSGALASNTTKAGCLFSVEDPHPGIYIVIRVGRLLREIEKGKESELTIKELEELCNTPLHSKFIQFVAWGAIPLFLDSSNTTIGMATGMGGNSTSGGMKWHGGKEDMPCTLYSIGQPFSDEIIFQLLTNDRELKRQKPLPSECYVSIRRFADDARGRMVEMQSFFPKQNAILHLVNLLYFYPTNLKIPKLKNPNIAVRIRLKEDDSDPNAEGIVAFYTRGSLVPNEGFAYSSVSFHEKAPFFTDEFKLQLPVNLNKRHHLLVSYHNVTPRRDTSQILGYSIIPLLKSNRILKDGDLVSGITVSLPQNYLRPDAQIKYLDSKKAFLHYRVRTYSSIHPQDDKLHDFFIHHNSDNTAPIVIGLRQANPAIVMNFFPVIFDQLLRIISNAFESTSKEAFLTLLSILPSPSNNQLVSYVEYLFDNPKPSGKFVHEEICRLWMQYLSDEKLHPIVERFPNSLNWFLLMLMRKSMMMSAREKGATTSPPDFQKNLSRLLGLLVQGSRCSALDQALSIAMFLKDMLYVLDSSIVYDMIEICVSGFQRQENNPMSELLKLTFIRVVTEHEGYLPLMMPESSKEIKNLGDSFKKQHYLTSLLLNEVQGSLVSGDAGRRRQAIETFRDILRKHAVDRRYQTTQSKQRITALYFPILTSITENFMILKPVLESQSEEPSSWLITVLHLVKDCDKELLRSWWTSKPQKIHLAFLALLDYALSILVGPPVTLASFVVLDIVQSFIYDYNGLEGDQEVNPLVEKFFDLLQKMMLSTNESFLLAIYSALETIAKAYGRIIFTVHNTPFCEKLCFDVLRHCKSSVPGTRSHASKFFYTLIKINQKEVGNISRMKLQSTVAIAKLVGMDQSKHDAAFFISLENSLKEIGNNATSDSAGSSIAIDAVQLTNNLMAIVRESKKISENSQDPEMVEDLYYTVSRSYVHSPDLRVAWLESLAVIHESNKSWVEAAQCKIFIASLVFQYRKAASNQMFRRTSLEDIAEVAPNVLREPELSEEARAEGSEAFQSEVWTIAGFFDLLKEASNLFEQAELYELSIQIYELIAPVHRMDKNFTEMHICYQKMQELCNKLIETEKKAKERLFPSYFRVAFYGEKFGEMNGKEFIYKEKPRTVLGNITERIKQQLTTKYPGVPIVVLPNSKDLPALKSDTLYIQVANVRTYDDPLEERVTEFDRHFNIKRFIFEMGFTTEGKGQSDDLSKQQKKKIIFNTQYSFPDIKKRQIVTHKEEIILTPIENALELINDKIRAIREILEISPPNKNKLQQLLTGTVMTMVNAGPVALCESFLAKEHVTKFSLTHVKEMRQRMDYFVLLCAFAVKLHKGVVGTEQQELHKQYETKFEVLKSKIKQFTSIELVESAFAPEKPSSPSKTTIVSTPTLNLPQLVVAQAAESFGSDTSSSSSTGTGSTASSSSTSPAPSSSSSSEKPTLGGLDSTARLSGGFLRGLASGAEVPFDLDRKVRNSTWRVKERRNTGVFTPAMFMSGEGEGDTSSSSSLGSNSYSVSPSPHVDFSSYSSEENSELSSLSEIAASLTVPTLSTYGGIGTGTTGTGNESAVSTEQVQQGRLNRASHLRSASSTPGGLTPPPVAPPRRAGSGVFGGTSPPPSSSSSSSS